MGADANINNIVIDNIYYVKESLVFSLLWIFSVTVAAPRASHSPPEWQSGRTILEFMEAIIQSICEFLAFPL